MAEVAPKTHLLIDGDVIAFIAAAAVQASCIDDFGWAQPIASTKAGEACVENMLFNIKQGLKADSFEVVLSDPTENWRRSVDPRYKTNRTGPRPLLLRYLKDYLAKEHGAYFWPHLEADDALGVMMTTPPKMVIGDVMGLAMDTPIPDPNPPRLICVGRDKDFKSIPGLHHAIKQDVDAKGNMLVREVTLWEADRFHLIQTLAGDHVDGFLGCPGVGMTSAERIIDNPVRLVPQPGVKTRGVNKGEAVTRWMSEPTTDLWACIVSHYRKAGQGEEDALRTARLARILRYGEYDPKSEKLTLWEPGMIKQS